MMKVSRCHGSSSSQVADILHEFEGLSKQVRSSVQNRLKPVLTETCKTSSHNILMVRQVRKSVKLLFMAEPTNKRGTK